MLYHLCVITLLVRKCHFFQTEDIKFCCQMASKLHTSKNWAYLKFRKAVGKVFQGTFTECKNKHVSFNSRKNYLCRLKLKLWGFRQKAINITPDNGRVYKPLCFTLKQSCSVTGETVQKKKKEIKKNTYKRAYLEVNFPIMFHFLSSKHTFFTVINHRKYQSP